MAWTTGDELRLTIVLGLRKGLALVRGLRRALTEDEQDRVAGAIADQLQRGWSIRRNDAPVAPGLHARMQSKGPDDPGPQDLRPKDLRPKEPRPHDAE